jgi:glycosyltransferase involved in cell wall biosynthesis
MRSFLAPAPVVPRSPGQVPTFSVIIAAFQAADSVGAAVESALSQTLRPLEVIVCDDGSTDEIERALRPYRDKIVFLRKEHGGAASAKNAAARAASGDFVAVLDADDIYLPEYLEAVGELAGARPDLDILAADAYLELDGEIYGRYYRGKARFVVDDQRKGIIHQHFIIGTAALRRQSLFATGGFNEEALTGVDADLLSRMVLDGATAGLVDEPLYVYRIREGSLSSSRPRSLRSAATILERVRSHPSLSPAERRFLESELAAKRRLATLAEAEEALRGLAGDPRRRSLRIAFGARGFGLEARIKALAAALAPHLAGRRLEARERKTGVSQLSSRTRGR